MKASYLVSPIDRMVVQCGEDILLAHFVWLVQINYSLNATDYLSIVADHVHYFYDCCILIF